MSCMLKGGEMKSVRGAVTASATTYIMSRTPSIVLPVRQVEQVGAYSTVHASRNDLVQYILLGRLQHPGYN